MAVSIAMPRQKEAGFDKFLRRLGGVVDVANSGIGTFANIKGIQEKNRLAEAAKIKAEEDAQGIYGQKELDPKDWMDAKEGEQGAQKFKVKGPNGVEEKFMRRYEAQAKGKSPEEIANLKAETNLKYAQAKKLGFESSGEKNNVEGFNISSGSKPTPDDAKNLKEASTYGRVIGDTLENLKGLVAEKGPEIMGGKTADQMSQYVTDARLNAKELYKLGVLSGPDMDLISSVIPDPTEFGQWAKWDAQPRMIKAIEQAQKIINDRVTNIAQSRGYQKGLQDLVKQKPQQIANEDKQAIEWAMSNPNDPRAAEILKKNNANIAR